MSICTIEDVRAALTKPFGFQLYVFRDRGSGLAAMGETGVGELTKVRREILYDGGNGREFPRN
jgi:hypothetical protein